LVINQVKADIEEWIENFVEVPHPALGNWPPCPFARRARLLKHYEVRLGDDLERDLFLFAKKYYMGKNEVVIYAYPPKQYDDAYFNWVVDVVNVGKGFKKRKLIALADHPDTVEEQNGVCFNMKKYALVLIQDKDKLNDHAKLLAQKGYYDGWNEEYLQDIFANRKDPRIK
tara:strand:+ start:22 stop:534 length:513 start_codon:yes stop_codon:yes gene_type:complete